MKLCVLLTVCLKIKYCTMTLECILLTAISVAAAFLLVLSQSYSFSGLCRNLMNRSFKKFGKE